MSSMAFLIALLCTIPPSLAETCLFVKNDFIRAGDLAARIGSFANVKPEHVLAPAPVGAARRWLRRPELESWLGKLGVQESVESGICVARVLKRLSGEDLKTAMKEALRDETVHIEIIDYSAYEVPPGRLEFKLNGLAGSPATRPSQAVFWRGKVVSEEGRSFPVWARVRVSVEREVLVAAREIQAGHKLAIGDLALEKRRVSPHSKQNQARIETAAGQVALRGIAAGDTIQPEKLSRPRDVSPGDLVMTEASGGAIRLRFTAKAETAGNVGDRIWLKPPGGGKRIPARLTAPGQAQVTEDQK